MSLLYLLAAGSLPTLISGAPLPSSLLARANDFLTGLMEPRSAGFGDVYTQYTGSGEQNWPSMDQWVSFDTLFSNSESVIAQSCTQFGATNPSSSEISDIKSGIQTVAGESGVDARFIFAIMMQESNGCVRAPTTNYGVRNPGLMQDHNGAATCNEGSQTNPCPASTITQMIRDGVEGTSSGDGLKQCLAQAGASGSAAYYRAARIYNSGSISGNDLSSGVATHCYSSDVANRLTGWLHSTHGCDLDGGSNPVNTVMPSSPAQTTAAYTPPAYTPPAYTPPASPTTTTTTPAAKPTQQPAPSKAPYVAPAAPAWTPPAAAPHHDIPDSNPFEAAVSQAAAPAASPTKVLGGATPAATKAPGVTDNCAEYHTVVDGDNCWLLGQTYGFTLAQFQSWNTQIDGGCSNLWKGYSYCVKQ